MSTNTRSTIWVDADGKTRQAILSGDPTGAGLAPVLAQLLAFSNADVQREWEGPLVVNPAPAPAAAPFQAIADYALLYFQDAVGAIATVTLPAPKSAIFLADQETVDPVAIATLIAACIGEVQTALGNAVTIFVGGVRRRSNRDY